MTIASIEKVFIEDLSSLYGPEEAGSIAWLVIGFVCKINRSKYLNDKNEDLNEEQLRTFYAILSELKKAVPVQYVLGETEFYGSVFKVSPAVLIPRPETEELVDWILKDAKANSTNNQGLRILDIGTGSGCIPITLKKYLPYMEVAAIDISSDALALAKENAQMNDTEVRFIQDDILHPFTEWDKFSIISSNPPYVTLSEKANMQANVLDYEPHLALFVPNDDPLIFYKAIARFAERHLENEGILYLEINENLGKETVSVLRDNGFRDIELRQDLRNKDRMIKARFN